MNIPLNVILIWAGLNSAIPSNWSRETSLDSKYAKASGAEDPDTTGGAASHTHTSTASHTHQAAAHTHTLTVPQPAARDTANNQIAGILSGLSHTHTGTTGAISTNNNFGSTSVTYGSVSNDPPYHAVIFIKASAGAVLQDNIIALWAGFGGDTTVPTNWQYCDGSNSSPDLRNKYLKGASTGADAGSTGGSTTNVHDISHSHTGASHDHSGYTTSTNAGPIKDGGGSCCSVDVHNHTYGTTGATTVTPNDYSGSLTTSETVEPVYHKLGAIQRKTGGLKAKGIIGMWLGSVANIPRGWVLCDGNNGTPNLTDKFIKIANTTGEIGNTGGSNTHTHASQNHHHTMPSHVHSNASKDHTGISRHSADATAGNFDDLLATDVHPAFDTDSASPDTTDGATAASSSSNQPPYRTVAYIQFQKPTDGGAFIFNVL